MTSVYRHTRGGWYAVQNLPSGRRVQIYLGKITKNQAETVGRRLAALDQSNRVGVEPSAEIAGWLSCVSPSLRAKLDAAGMLAQWRRAEASPLLADYWRLYVESRTDLSASSIKGFGTAWGHVNRAFPDATLASITVADAKQFSRDLASLLASTHAKKILERVRMVFAHAIDSKRIAANPFDGLTIRATVDADRKRYVDETTALAVLAQFQTLEGRALFALARFCGLRVPHEPLALTWDCVDWENLRLRIPADTKTGGRVVPLFPHALRELEALDGRSTEGATSIFTRARGSAATSWRDWLKSAIQTAGVKPWPKLWHNLRASCRTDLEDRFPTHVCDAWLGHSSRVARDHYLTVTPDHWATAIGSPTTRTAPTEAHGAEYGG